MLGFKEEQIGNSPDEWLKRVHPDDQNLSQGKSYLTYKRKHPSLRE